MARVLRERLPVASWTTALNVSTRVCRSVASRSTSLSTPLAALASSSGRANRSPSMPSAVLPNIWISRRYESHAKRSSDEIAASPSTEASLSPTLRTVSIMPGIEYFAPDRTDTSSGSSGSPS